MKTPLRLDLTTVHVSSQGHERRANIKAVLKCHLENKQWYLWAKAFHVHSPIFLSRLGFSGNFLCALLRRRSLCFSES